MKKILITIAALFLIAGTTSAQLNNFENQFDDSTNPVVLPETGPTCHQFSTALGMGSTGQNVEQLQRYLVARGLLSSGLPYGYFGTLTEQAVKTLQSQNGLESVGYVGPRTRAILNNCLDSNVGDTTINTTVTAPSVPTNVRATAISGTQVSITWDAVPGATHYTLGRSSGTTITNTIYIGRAAVNSYIDATTNPGNTYTYAVSAWRDTVYSTTSGRSASVTTPTNTLPPPTSTPPAAPTNVRATAVSGTNVDVTWNTVSEATHYTIGRSSGTNFTSTIYIGRSSTNSYTDTTVSPGGTYSYAVSSWKDTLYSNTSGRSAVVTTPTVVVPPPPPPTLPPPPTTTTASTITLSANPSTVNYGEPISLRVSLPSQAGTIAPSYCLWPDGHRSTSFPASFTYYPGKTIVYEVKCYDSSNTVKASASAIVNVNAPAATTRPTVSLTASPSTTIKYGESVTLRLSSTGADYCAAIVTPTNQIVNPNGATSGSLTFKPTETASYGVSCYNTGGKPISQWPAGTPASITITVNPLTSDSTGPTLSSDSSGNLSWNPVRNNAGQAATLYGVGITRPGNSEVEYFVTSTSYTPTGEGPGATIKFRVRAVSPFTSPWSNQMSVTIPETTSSNTTQLQMIANAITALQQLLNSIPR